MAGLSGALSGGLSGELSAAPEPAGKPAGDAFEIVPFEERLAALRPAG